jgi:hypothetical protein
MEATDQDRCPKCGADWTVFASLPVSETTGGGANKLAGRTLPLLECANGHSFVREGDRLRPT